MTSSSYAEWCRLSGVYVANVSHFERYQTYAGLLSPAGVTVAIVSDFLDDAPTMNVDDWRTHCVYEFGGQRDERVKLTAEALRKIGATGLASAVESAKSSSPMELLQGLFLGGGTSKGNTDPFALFQQALGQLIPGSAPAPRPETRLDIPAQQKESRAEAMQLLEQFTQNHANDLQQDIDRHGDPRLAPGFSVERRKRELDALRNRHFSHQTQAEAIEALSNVMNRLPKLVEQKTPGKEKKAAQHLKQLLREWREKARELRQVASADRSDDCIAFLPKLEEFENRHAALLRPDVFGDDELRRRAEAIGPFESKKGRKSISLSWDAPAGLESDWLRFSLAVEIPATAPGAMRAALGAVERLQKEFAALQADWRQQALDSFRDAAGQMDLDEFEEDELDEEGEPTDEAILRQVESGQIALSASDPEGRTYGVSAALEIEWDEEHGLELDCDLEIEDDAPAVPEAPAPKSAARTSPAGKAVAKKRDPKSPPDQSADSSGDAAAVVEPEAHFDPGQTTLNGGGPSVSDADFARFETTTGMVLPGAYRAFLRHTNGGVPSRSQLVRRAAGEEDVFDIVRFFSLSGATEPPFPHDSLQGQLASARGKLLGKHLLPITRLRQGSFPPIPPGEPALAIVLAGKRAGRIILFDAEMMLPPPGEMSTDQLRDALLDEMTRSAWSVANDLPALFRKLRPAPTVQVPDWLTAIRTDAIDPFLAWVDAGGSPKEVFIEPGSLFRPTVVDLLAAEGSPALLEVLLKRHWIRPGSLRESWQKYLILDVPRFEQLMTVLPRDAWSAIFASPRVWDHPDLLEKIVAAGVDIETPLNDDGATPLHRAVEMGHIEGVRWLLQHGADVHRTNKYGFNALTFAESGPGYACLPLLQGKAEPAPTGASAPDAPGVSQLADAAASLAKGRVLQVQIEIKAPPVTRVEKLYYGTAGCHYRLTFTVGDGQVTYNDTQSPRQDYLHTKGWAEARFAPILQWPELTPMWETLQVVEFEPARAFKSRKYIPEPRADLVPAARSTLEQAFQAEEAAARGIRLRK